MKLKHRLVIIGILLVVFAIITPVTILLTRGYRYDFSNHRLVKTGALIVKTLPRGAKIFLNDKLYGSTPDTIRFLIPGEYKVLLKKAGYKPWEKTLSILPEQVVFAHPKDKKITLFLEQPKLERISTGTIDFIYTSNHLVYWYATSTVNFFDNETKKEIRTNFPYKEPQKIGIEVAADGVWAFLQNQYQDFLINLEDNQAYDITFVPGRIIKAASLNSREVLLLTDKANLYKLNPKSKTLTLLREEVASFQFSKDRLYYVQAGLLYAADPNGSSEELLAEFPVKNFHNFQIIPTDGSFIFVIADGNLYFIAEELKLLDQNITNASWNEEAEQLLYFNLSGIWLFDPQSGKRSQLITRSSDPIRQAFFNPVTDQIFYLQGNKIKAIEAHGQVTRAIVELINPSDAIEKFATDSRGKHLYFLTSTQELFSAQIR